MRCSLDIVKDIVRDQSGEWWTSDGRAVHTLAVMATTRRIRIRSTRLFVYTYRANQITNIQIIISRLFHELSRYLLWFLKWKKEKN